MSIKDTIMDIVPGNFFKAFVDSSILQIIFISFILGTFATGSCNASIPLCLKTAQEELGVERKTASFSIPIGVSLHCASNCIFYMISLFFLANIYSTVPMTPLDFPAIFFSIFLLGIGAPSVSGSGPICVALLLMQMSLPAGLITLIIGLDPFVSMNRTGRSKERLFCYQLCPCIIY